MDKQGKLITIAIHTYEKAVILKTLLEKEGITAVLHNVNLIQPVVSSGVRVRIHEEDLPLALKIIESSSILKQGGDEALGNTVFIPVDFSEYSAKACFIGFDLAYRLGGDVVLFHTFLDQKYAGIFPLDSDEYEIAIWKSEIRLQKRVDDEGSHRISECKPRTSYSSDKEGYLPACLFHIYNCPFQDLIPVIKFVDLIFFTV